MSGWISIIESQRTLINVRYYTEERDRCAVLYRDDPNTAAFVLAMRLQAYIQHPIKPHYDFLTKLSIMQIYREQLVSGMTMHDGHVILYPGYVNINNVPVAHLTIRAMVYNARARAIRSARQMV